MSLRKRLAISFLLWPLLATPAAAAIFNPATKILPNGLEVIVVENHRAPVALQMIWYHTGSADEDPLHPGLAHYLEHMMFKGTKDHPDQDFSAEVAGLGGEDNAFTSYDYTAFYQRVPPAALPTVMAMEAERMTGLMMAEQKFDTEKSVIQQERGERNESTPEAKFSVKLQSVLYKGHPYERPVIGTEASIAGLTRDELYDYYQAHYAPNNATLVIVGDVKAEDAFAEAEAAYGAIPSKTLPNRVRSTLTAQKPQQLTVADKNVQQPLLALAWHAPNYKHADKVNPYALDILADLMNLPDSSLQQDLVYQHEIAVSVNADYDGDKFDDGDFTVTLSPRPGMPLDKATGALKQSLAALQKAGITADQLARAKKRLIESAELARDPLSAAAYAFGVARATGETVDDVENWPDKIDAVTLADMQAALKFLAPAPAVTAKLVGSK